MSIPCKMRPVCIGEVLPMGYRRVEWLFSDVSQYVDTNYIPDNETGLQTSSLCAFIKGVNPDNTNGDDSFIGGMKYFAPFRLVDGTSIGYIWNSWSLRGGHNKNEEPPVANAELNWLNNRRSELKSVGYNYSIELTTPLNKCDDSIHIFRVNQRGNAFKGYLYFFRISQGGDIVRDFIPCLDATGAPCLIDTVNKQPYYNKGTGDFLYPTESTTYALRRVLPDWGKLTENGLRRLYHAPAGYQGELYDYALENGYKPIVEPEKPEEGYWVPRWTETEDEIALEWVETEPPTEYSTEFLEGPSTEPSAEP